VRLGTGGVHPVADRERDGGADRKRYHGRDERKPAADAGRPDHQRADELGAGIEDHGERHDAAAMAVADDAVQPYLGRRPRRGEAGAEDEARGEPDRRVVGGEDRGEREDRQREGRRHEPADAEEGDEPRQERADEEDAGAGERGVEADQPVRQADLFERESEVGIGEGRDDGFDRHQEKDAVDRPERGAPAGGRSSGAVLVGGAADLRGSRRSRCECGRDLALGKAHGADAPVAAPWPVAATLWPKGATGRRTARAASVLAG